jgi:2'-5' RNA ligase
LDRVSELKPPERLRLFIALQVPERIKETIEQTQLDLGRKLAGAKIRWAGRQQFHLTLRFLGSVDVPRLPDLLAAVQGACPKARPFELRAEGLGCFPNTRSPRVVWVGVKDLDNRLLALQQAIQDSTQPFTAEPTENRFSAHITLGRVRLINRIQTKTLGAFVAERAEFAFGNWTAREVELIRSQLSPKGSAYSSLAAISVTTENE